MGVAMFSNQELGQFVEVGNRLIDLYVRRAQACGQEDWHRLRVLEREIARVSPWPQDYRSAPQTGARPEPRAGC